MISSYEIQTWLQLSPPVPFIIIAPTASQNQKQQQGLQQLQITRRNRGGRSSGSNSNIISGIKASKGNSGSGSGGCPVLQPPHLCSSDKDSQLITNIAYSIESNGTYPCRCSSRAGLQVWEVTVPAPPLAGWQVECCITGMLDTYSATVGTRNSPRYTRTHLLTPGTRLGSNLIPTNMLSAGRPPVYVFRTYNGSNPRVFMRTLGARRPPVYPLIPRTFAGRCRLALVTFGAGIVHMVHASTGTSCC